MKTKTKTKIQVEISGVQVVFERNETGRVTRTLYLKDPNLNFPDWRRENKAKIDELAAEADKILI